MKYRRATLTGVLVLGLIGASVLVFDRWIAKTELPNLSLATSTIVTDRHGDLLRAYTIADGRWRLPATVDDVDPRYLDHVIAFEDKRFYRHHGVDPLAVVRAMGQAVWNGKIVSGGSTLTMQVARLLEGSGTGQLGSKLRQARLALALERQLSKREILNLYLKLAPFGGNLEGVRAATLSYFGKEPNRLTVAQSALLVALPQSPETRRPDRFPDYAVLGRNRVLDRLLSAGELDDEMVNSAKSETISPTRRSFPAFAAHLADRVYHTDRFSPIHQLTVERDLQEGLEILARQFAQDQDRFISAAVLVMDHQSGEVLASVGSAGFLDQNRHGFIDMTRAIRSPGSTLKPLIYGLAFESGLAHPETMMQDRPTAFGAYAPQNFDKQFYGTLPARQALQLSLNIPAVALLEAVGPTQLVARLKRVGVTARLPGEAPPGLAIALGGLGLSLTDLVTIYAAIARGGTQIDLHTDLNARPKPASISAILSPESAWQVSDILAGVRGPATAANTNLAYKTGTSYGYRDAWAIGFDGQHVIGVWMGRPDGGSIPGILGADLAAPLLFSAFERLKPKLVPLASPPPATLIVQNADLPLPLKRFRGTKPVFEIDVNLPEIAFPPDGARIDLGIADGKALPLVLKVRNGIPPFTWVADGVPILIAQRGRHAMFETAGPGFLKISVIDAAGQSHSSLVELQ